jgi:hypothetical protein
VGRAQTKVEWENYYAYGMEKGSAVLTVRYAMLFYVLKRLGLLGDAAKLPARSQHIVVVNQAETEAALEKADFAA